MKKILFVCTGNTCRSVLAHRYAAKLAADEKLPLKFSSAGLAAHKNIPQPPIVASLLSGEGVKKFKHSPTALTDKLVKSSDLILAMTAGHKASLLALHPRAAKKISTLTEYAGLGGDDIADPYGQDDIFYREIFKLIKSAVEAAVEKLKKK